MGKQMKKRHKEALMTVYECDKIDYRGRAALGAIAVFDALLLSLSAIGIGARYDEYATLPCAVLMAMAGLFALAPYSICEHYHRAEVKAETTTARQKRLRTGMAKCVISLSASIVTLSLLVALCLTTTECHCHPALLIGICAYLCLYLALSGVIVWAFSKSFGRKSYVRGWSHSQQ